MELARVDASFWYVLWRAQRAWQWLDLSRWIEEQKRKWLAADGALEKIGCFGLTRSLCGGWERAEE